MASIRRTYSRGLHEVGNGLYAYLQPDGGWGWSNAGLVAGVDEALLVDTLFDLRLTEEMLAAMRAALGAAASIGTVVNTHANGDHCYGNQLVRDALIVASARTAEEMSELPATAMAALVAQAPAMGDVGAFFLRCFGQFSFDGIEAVLPSQTFEGELTLRVGGRELELIEAGPAHTRGDTLVLLADDRVLFAGDLLFNGSHPIVWAGPVSNWIAACERVLTMDVDVIVPGHGPLAGMDDVRELRDYLAYLLEQGRRLHEEGLTPVQAARALELDRWARWGEGERLAVNIDAVYRELDPELGPVNALEAFAQMAELAGGTSASSKR
jgi:cyclase